MKTLFGRRRLVPELTSHNGQVRSAAERVSVNLPIQGTAADILKRAMIDVHGRSRPARARGTGADDPDRPRRAAVRGASDETDEVVALVRAGMERASALSVPLTVDVGVGANWRGEGMTFSALSSASLS